MSTPNWYYSIFNRYKELLQSKNHLYLALSAGVDSNLLLHWLSTFRHDLPPISTIHVNHHLHGNYSDIWADFARKRSQFYNIPFIYFDIYLNPKDPRGVEAAGREERYLKFAETMQQNKNSLLLAAHHRSDQAETIFYRLLRSSGIKGMGAMRDLTNIRFGNYYIDLFRPFLSISKKELYNTAERLNISWMEDYTNHEVDFTRNKIRNGIFPEVQKYFPRYEEAFYQTSQFLQESYDLLSEIAKEDLAAISLARNQISRDKLLRYSLPRQKNILHYWLSLFHITLTQDQINEFLRSYVSNRPTHQSRFELGAYTLHYFKNDLYLIYNAISNQKPNLEWISSTGAPPQTFWMQKRLILKPREPGIRFHPLQREKSQTLKKLLQEAELPTWHRQNIWMLCDSDTDEVYWISHIGLTKSLHQECRGMGVIPHLIFHNKQ